MCDEKLPSFSAPSDSNDQRVDATGPTSNTSSISVSPSKQSSGNLSTKGTAPLPELLLTQPNSTKSVLIDPAIDALSSGSSKPLGRNKVPMGTSRNVFAWIKVNKDANSEIPRRITVAELNRHCAKNWVGNQKRSAQSSATAHPIPILQAQSVSASVPGEAQEAEEDADAPVTSLWISIRFQVYDITRFLEFHPGGEAVLRFAAGTEATEKFDRHHPYVNAANMLSAFYVGPLVPDIPFVLSPPNLEHAIRVIRKSLSSSEEPEGKQDEDQEKDKESRHTAGPMRLESSMSITVTSGNLSLVPYAQHDSSNQATDKIPRSDET